MTHLPGLSFDLGERIEMLLHSLGADSGFDLDALVDCGAWISASLNREVGSRVTRALLSKRPAAVAA